MKQTSARDIAGRNRTTARGRGAVRRSSASATRAQLLAEIQRRGEELELERQQSEAEGSALIASQHELEVSRERYAELYDYAPVGYLALDRNGVVLRANFTAGTMLGWERDKLIGCPLVVHAAAGDRRVFHEHLWRARREDSPVTSEVRFQTAAGATLVAQMASVRRRDTFGKGFQFHVALTDITARRLAETALQTKGTELQSITDTTTVMLTRCSRDMRYRFANRAAAETLGMAPEQIVGKSVREVMGDAAYKAVLPHAKKVLKGQPVEYETEIPYRGAGRRFAHVVYVPDRNQRGEVTGWVGAITDITERKQEERRLQVRDAINAELAADPTLQKAAPRILQTLCEQTGWDAGALWLADPAGRELQCVNFWHRPNEPVPKFEADTRRRRYKHGKGQFGKVWITGKPLVAPDLALKPDFLRADSAHKSGLRSGFCSPIKLGKEVLGVLEGYSRQQRQPDKGFLNLLAAVSDKLGQFIKRKQAQEALRQSEGRLRRILNTALDAIITINANGVITGWNPQAEHIFGWTLPEALGRRLADTVIPPRYRAAYEQSLQHYMKTGEGPMLEKRIELTALHRSGREFPVELAITPFTLDDQLAFSAFVEDISERKAAEEMLRRAHDELEQRVRERTAELAKANAELSRTLARIKRAEAALRKSREHYLELFKEAQAARRETQRLSSLVIQAQEKERKHISRELHDDVGQTLTAVSMTLNGVNRNGDGNAEANRLKLAEAQRLLQGIMATLHDFARELRPSVLDELGLLSAIRSAARSVEEQTGLRVRLRGDPLAEQLSSEQKLALFRIVQEGLSNVVRHAYAKRVKITLAKHTAGVVLTVADDGKSFDAMQRSSSRRGRLGLLGMQERARLVNGKFTIRARPGKGTTVQVLIPLKPTAPSANAEDGKTAERKIRKNKN